MDEEQPISQEPQPGTTPNTIVVPDAKITAPVSTKFLAFGSPTPPWAKGMFVTYFIVSKAVIGYLGTTHIISGNLQYEILALVTTLIDPIMYGFSEAFGLKTDEK